MSGIRVVGRRIDDGEFFTDEPMRGDYGRVEVTGQGWRWFVCLPNGVHGVLDPRHVVEETEGGRITVSPSIEHHGQIIVGSPMAGGPPISDSSGWHGFLVDGVWIEA